MRMIYIRDYRKYQYSGNGGKTWFGVCWLKYIMVTMATYLAILLEMD